MSRANTKILHKETIVNAPRSDVWLRWTTHEGLKTFIGRDNRITLKPGGPFEIYFNMDAPEGSRGAEGCRVLSFLPERMLSFSWNAPPTIPEIRNQDHHTWVVVQLSDSEDGKTIVSLDHLGWLDGEKWDETYDYFDHAWGHVLSSLEDALIGER